MERKTPKQQLLSALKWIGWALLVQFILINICAALYAHKLTHFYEGLPEQRSMNDMNIFARSWKIFSGPKYPKSHGTERPSFPVDSVVISLPNKQNLSAWYGRSDSSAKGTVLLFHGIGGDKSFLIDEAEAFRQFGYNIMLVDFTGHGNSDGLNTTIGVKEAAEVKAAYDYVNSGGEKNIFLYGSSMGAVTVMKAVHDFSLQLKGIVIEMPFKSLQCYLKGKARVLGFPNQPFALLTTFWIGLERGFNGYRHCSTRYGRSIHCPVLMQWGALDNLVLENETTDVYNSIASPNKKLIVFPDAQHESLLRKDPLKWRIEVERFMTANNP
jgi:alpha-beta hydrolase superfamily lysophospholipase